MHPAPATESVRFAAIVSLDEGEPGRAPPFALELGGQREPHARLACAVGTLIGARRSRPDRQPIAIMVPLTLAELERVDVDALTAALIPVAVAPDLLMIRVPHYAAGAPAPMLERLAATGLTIVVANLVVRSGELGLLAGAPVDMIELPPALVDDVDRSLEGADRVQALMAVAHQVDWLVLARNVRRPSQARALQRLGCDLAAGPLMGAPIELADAVPDAHARRSRLAG